MSNEISPYLIEILECPVTKGKVVYNKETQELISEAAGLAYPIIDGIPMMLAEHARKISENSKEKLTNRS